tara:strand:- start:241 stop:402 length:162 start_codon:yes stop_codon:yes gene_type:complete
MSKVNSTKNFFKWVVYSYIKHEEYYKKHPELIKRYISIEELEKLKEILQKNKQ